MPTRFTMDSGWKKWERAINPRLVDATIRHNLRRATALNGKLAIATIRQTIRAGVLPANADLTVMIKSSSKPLVDNATTLFQAITDRVIDDVTVFAGVLETDGEYNIAVALHEGAVIRVTPAMRGMFFWLLQASKGAISPDRLEGRARQLWERSPGGWAPLKDTTSSIVIPGRPFIQQAFANNEMRTKAKENWRKALQAAFRDLARGGR